MIETVYAIQKRLAQTPSLLAWTEQLRLVAEHDVPVLITGETGAGKTWLARIIHDCSSRQKKPFVTVPCGSTEARSCCPTISPIRSANAGQTFRPSPHPTRTLFAASVRPPSAL